MVLCLTKSLEVEASHCSLPLVTWLLNNVKFQAIAWASITSEPALYQRQHSWYIRMKWWMQWKRSWRMDRGRNAFFYNVRGAEGKSAAQIFWYTLYLNTLHAKPNLICDTLHPGSSSVRKDNVTKGQDGEICPPPSSPLSDGAQQVQDISKGIAIEQLHNDFGTRFWV